MVCREEERASRKSGVARGDKGRLSWPKRDPVREEAPCNGVKRGTPKK